MVNRDMISLVEVSVGEDITLDREGRWLGREVSLEGSGDFWNGVAEA